MISSSSLFVVLLVESFLSNSPCIKTLFCWGFVADPRNNGGFDKSFGKQQPLHGTNLSKEGNNLIRKNEVINGQPKPARPVKVNSEYKANEGGKPRQGKTLVEVQKKAPTLTIQDVSVLR